ncbi:MAG: hypothetical protein CMP68_01490 [Flavobacteriales bacterium]|nr:hypothetical protein [Flavobacteriales bacterium]
MLQRIQSIYLFVVFMCYFSYSYFGFEYYKKGYNLININFDFIFNLSSYIPYLISIICLVSIFLFKKRILQIKLVYSCIYLSSYMVIFSGFYFYLSLNDLIEIMPSNTFKILLYAAMINPFFSTYFLSLALNSIKNDEKLVRGEGLIR